MKKLLTNKNDLIELIDLIIILESKIITILEMNLTQMIYVIILRLTIFN